MFNQDKEGTRVVKILAGAVISAIAINEFIIPAGLYAGGFTGTAQLISLFLKNVFHINPDGIQLYSVIYYVMNFPALVIMLRTMGGKYTAKTIMAVTVNTVAMGLIPSITPPILGDDILSNCVVGGVLMGIGISLMLTSGASDGGMDTVGVLLVNKYKGNLSIGHINLAVNSVLYTIMLFLFDWQVVIYSMIYAVITNATLDRMYSQNINTEVHIITKKETRELEQKLMAELNRGATRMNAIGAYSEEKEHVLYMIISKYEVRRLREIVTEYDPHAFVVTASGVSIIGNFKKHLK